MLQSVFPYEFLEILAVVQRRKGDTWLSIDTETNAEDVRDGRGLCHGISFCIKLAHDMYVSTYVPMNHRDSENNVPVEPFKEAIESFDGWAIFHDSKFDLESLRTVGINYTGKFYDTLLICHLINENFPYSKSLNDCVRAYVSSEESKKEGPLFKASLKIFGWAGIPVLFMREYAEYDAYITYKLMEQIDLLYCKEELQSVWEHRQKFVRTIIAMERRGVRLDAQLCHREVAKGEAAMAEVTQELGINPGSSIGLNKLLIEKLKLPVVKKSKKTGKPSFDKEAMEVYDEILERNSDPTAKAVLRYRGWQKAVSSNYRPYLELVSKDGRLRPNYKLHGTKTGRMSCEKPNLQQIPRISSKEWNGHLKSAFIPADGFVLCEADYSQLELRLGTAYAREESLVSVFEEGRDIFTEMAAQLGMSRQDTKTFVYSTQYGAGLTRLMNVFGITQYQASQMRNGYFEKYPGFRRVTAAATNKCLQNGKVRLWSGRYRHFMRPKEESHKAFNSVIQGGAADIVERIMVRLYEEIDNETECRMLLQVHDSVVFEIKQEKLGYYKQRILEVMTNVQQFGDFGVVFAVDFKEWGKS